jgi:hypothetical protein
MLEADEDDAGEQNQQQDQPQAVVFEQSEDAVSIDAESERLERLRARRLFVA